MELEAGTQDDEALQVQHTSSCPLTCRARGLVYAGQKPQWLDLDGVSWWMLVGRWSRGFNDCDQGCRFVILAALEAQSPLYARQRRQGFLALGRHQLGGWAEDDEQHREEEEAVEHAEDDESQ